LRPSGNESSGYSRQVLLCCGAGAASFGSRGNPR
jgi:hypothetical protein